MKRKRQPKMTATQFRRFKETLLQAKADERRQPTLAPVIYSDNLLRASVVVETDGGLWLVPRRPGGWSSRQRLQMTDAAKVERLTPARDVQPGWLGIDGGNGCEVSTVASADGQP